MPKRLLKMAEHPSIHYSVSAAIKLNRNILKQPGKAFLNLSFAKVMTVTWMVVFLRYKIKFTIA